MELLEDRTMNHYYKIALAFLAALSACTPAMAANAGSTNCATSSSQANPAQIQNCLNRMNDPSHVRERQQQEKRDRCEQNAKNRNLGASAKASFISSCMNENQAATAHAAVAQGHADTKAPPKASSHPSKPAPAAKRKHAGNSCVAQANKQHLKGKKRREFLKDCH
jgi:hypothetical protein